LDDVKVGAALFARNFIEEHGHVPTLRGRVLYSRQHFVRRCHRKSRPGFKPVLPQPGALHPSLPDGIPVSKFSSGDY
jgi:hypothetical protein